AAGIDRGRIEWLDRASPSEPLVLGDITLRAFGLDDTAEEAGRFALDVRDAARGVLAAEGEIAVGTRRIDAHAEFENIDVAPIAALWFASPVISGAASGSAALEWSGDSRTLHLRDASLRTIRLGAVHPDGTRLTAASAEAAGDARWLEGQLHFSGRIDLDR